MLVLSRKKGESILFGQDICLEVLSIEGDCVRIGINAPKEVRIFRKELLEQTIDINKQATSAPPISFGASE